MNKTILNNTGTRLRQPRPSEVQFGELVLNYHDRALYYKTSDGTIDSFSSDTRETSSTGSFSWDDLTPTPNSIEYYPGIRRVTRTHNAIRRCILSDSGVVQYYLNPFNSNLKADGSPANLVGDDGQVMVEIPKFYAKNETIGSITTWSISDQPQTGYVVHPAFIKDGVEVSHRYIGAYDASVFSQSSGSYISGLNLDNSDSLVDRGVDLLSSVSGQYPMVGQTRDHFRTLAANRGPGWSQVDFWLIQAIQLLYLVEYQTFNSQVELGQGNVNSSYLGSSSDQNDSPHSISGFSNSWGGRSSDGAQPFAGSRPGTAWMSYRGIENLFGNCWNWVDGFNILDRQAWVSNTRPFVDNTSTGFQSLGQPMPAANGFVRSLQNLTLAFLPSSTTGGSSSTFITDNYFQSTGWQVARFGGSASFSLSAGLFSWFLTDSSGFRFRIIGSRVAF